MKRLVLIAALLIAAPAGADEGFWTFDHFPRRLVKERYGVEVDPQVLAHVARAAVSLSNSSGAFVSDHGLVAIKQGAVKSSCLHALREARRSTGRLAAWCRDPAIRQAVPLFDRLYCRPLERAAEYDYIERGYLARTAADELRCPGLSARNLVDVTDVTARVRAAADQKKERGEIEKECKRQPGQRCEVLGLHGDMRFERHRYRIFDDVRLVFAPERRVADYGDVQDTMTFPDHDFKTAFLRVYEGGRPASTPEHLRFSTRVLREGELTLMAGFVGPTGRRGLAEQLQRGRDFREATLIFDVEKRGLLTALVARRPGLAPALDFDERNNSIVVRENWLRSAPPEAIAARAREEEQLVAALERQGDPHLGEIKRALAEAAAAHLSYTAVRDRGMGLVALGTTTVMNLAIGVVVGAATPAADRQAPEPIFFDQEVVTSELELGLRRLQQACPPDDELLRAMLGGLSAHDRAAALVRGTRLGDPELRRRMIEGGPKAIAAAHDPVLDLARVYIAQAESLGQTWNHVGELARRAADLLAAARYRLHGDDEYPEGNGSVRLSFGALAGYTEAGRTVAPVTTLGDLFTMAKAGGPYQLAPAWEAARGTLNMATPLNLATNHDLSMAAVLLDVDGAMLGVAFNTNRYRAMDVYDAKLARQVVVHNAAVVEILRGVYHANALLTELGQ